MLLLFSSGELDDWTWRWLGSGHWYLRTPQHLSAISRPFLRCAAERHGLELLCSQAIPHPHAGVSTRFGEWARAIKWELRQRGGAWRPPHRLLQTLPKFRQLRHMQSGPWTMTSRDHLLALCGRRA